MEEPLASPQGKRVAGIDLGEIHMALCHDGTTRIFSMVGSCAPRGSIATSCKPSSIVGSMVGQRAERLGMQVQLQDESYTSKTCPHCLHRRKSAVQGRTVRCSKCAFTWHRDGVGACTIRGKYLDLGPVVGAMAAPIGIRYRPHLGVARWEKEYQRENVCAGNCTEAAGLRALAQCHAACRICYSFLRFLFRAAGLWISRIWPTKSLYSILEGVVG
jgi:hypothetical protein